MENLEDLLMEITQFLHDRDRLLHMRLDYIEDKIDMLSEQYGLPDFDYSYLIDIPEIYDTTEVIDNADKAIENVSQILHEYRTQNLFDENDTYFQITYSDSKLKNPDPYDISFWVNFGRFPDDE